MKWPIRNLLNPVSTRSLLYGTDPFDMEYVLQKVDQIKVLSGKQIKVVWFSEWERKANKYLELAQKAEAKNNRISSEKYYMLTAQCYYAAYMINTDDLDKKREVYKFLEKYYMKAVSFRKNKVEYVEIDTVNGKLPGFIHFPDDGSKGKYPITVTYSGVGSCKEELDMLALPLVERGVAVLTVDMPGTGSALFDYDRKVEGEHLEAAFESIMKYLEGRDDIDSDRIANYGLCMGGGYAFRSSAKYAKTKCCVSLFPLFIGMAAMDSIPVWMKQGKWSTYQYGENGDTLEKFSKSMSVLVEGTIDCDFLIVHSDDDNWMDAEASEGIFAKAKGYKEQLAVDEKPAYVSEETIMHAMPVGEQFHWVKHIASDFIAERLLEGQEG